MLILCLTLLSVWGEQNIFVFCILKGIFLKGMGERSSLSKDECLTSDNGKVKATNVIHQFPPILLIIVIFCSICEQL